MILQPLFWKYVVRDLVVAFKAEKIEHCPVDIILYL